MPRNHTLRIHFEYDVLYVGDIRAVLTDFERAYNLLEHTQEATLPHGNRLAVKTLATGHSVEIVILGVAGLVTLARVIKGIADTRESVWKSEEMKWKAKTAKLEFQESQKSIGRVSRKEERPPADRALEIIKNRVRILRGTKHIHTFQIEIDGETTELSEKSGSHLLPDQNDE
jgi:hypothetical protein